MFLHNMMEFHRKCNNSQSPASICLQFTKRDDNTSAPRRRFREFRKKCKKTTLLTYPPATKCTNIPLSLVISMSCIIHVYLLRLQTRNNFTTRKFSCTRWKHGRPTFQPMKTKFVFLPLVGFKIAEHMVL